jgi:plastocyanin
MLRAPLRTTRSFAAVAAGAGLLLGLGGCTLKHPSTNLVRGKQLFVAKCAACHTLRRAAASGTVGPNLDDAFRQDRADGFKNKDIQELVSFWIQYPDKTGVMPAGLYTGEKADDVASYVGAVAAMPGEDTGALGNAVASVAQHAATEQNGIVEIDADPSGQLKFLAQSATAKAGKVTLRMKNASSVMHDIAITGNGVNQIGAVVANGGTSTVSTTLKPGTYTFYCSVDGHEAAGMKGTLTVK